LGLLSQHKCCTNGSPHFSVRASILSKRFGIKARDDGALEGELLSIELNVQKFSGRVGSHPVI